MRLLWVEDERQEPHRHSRIRAAEPDVIHSIPPSANGALQHLAVGVGFEPTEGFHLRQFSRLLRSTTPPPHRARNPNDHKGRAFTSGTIHRSATAP